MQNAQKIIEKLGLKPHPEGGFYKEVYRDPHKVRREKTAVVRNASTAIYYLLNGNDFSSLHRLKSTECWHYYQGTTELLIYEIKKNGRLKKHILSLNFQKGSHFTYIKPGSWFSAGLVSQQQSDYVLVGCTVAPGFEFSDFEIGKREKLLEAYPQHKDIIIQFSK